MQKAIVFGIGDLAELLYYSNITGDYDLEIVAFTVDKEYCTKSHFCSLPIVAFEELQPRNLGVDTGLGFFICVGYSNMNHYRKQIFERISKLGYPLLNYIDRQATVRTKDMGCGNIIFDGANIGVGSKIGDGNIFYPNSMIGHHSIIGNFNFFAPAASVAGRVTVGNNCFLGIASCTRDKIVVADETLLGAGCYLGHNSRMQEVYVPARSICLNIKSNMGNL